MLKTRIITALAMLGCFIPALYYLPDTFWAFLMLALSLLALYEWGGMIGLTKQSVNAYVLISFLLGAVVVYGIHVLGFHGVFYQSLNVFIICNVFWILIVPVWLAKGWQVRNRYALMLLGWLMIGALWLALLFAKRLDPNLLLMIISTIWIADSAAYFAGKNFGKRKLAPSISPGKTWEGVVGAILSVSIFAILIKLIGAVDTWLVIPALWLITIAGVYGDLFESLFKRQANLKDSGQILPGHGGILDRIDGVVPAMPIGLLMIYFYHLTRSLS